MTAKYIITASLLLAASGVAAQDVKYNFSCVQILERGLPQNQHIRTVFTDIDSKSGTIHVKEYLA